MWFDSIELMNNGNAVVKKGMQYNFLKSNGTLLSSEWYDEITPASEAGKFVVRRGSAYNVIDNNLRFISRKWQDSIEDFPCFPQKATAPNLTVRKSWSNIQLYDPVWLNDGGDIVECYFLSYSGGKLTILWPIGDTVVKKYDMMVEMSYDNNEESVWTPRGWLHLNNPVL